jgi:hypothetical protein
MKKNIGRFNFSGKAGKGKYLFIISILAIVLLFSAAATCSFCAIDLNQGTSTTGQAPGETNASKAPETSKETTTQTSKESKPEVSITEAETGSSEAPAGSSSTSTEAAKNPPAINSIKVTDNGSGVTYDPLATDVPLEWMNQLPTSLELHFHLGVSDPDNDILTLMLSDSKGNNFEPVDAVNGNIDFNWTSPSVPGELELIFKVIDHTGLQAEKTIKFTFNDY